MVLSSALVFSNFTFANSDSDLDGVFDSHDNCPQIANEGQWDKDNDGQGNECDPDIDGDGFSNEVEIAAGSKPWRADSIPDDNIDLADDDGDGVLNSQDNCPQLANAGQWDKDLDGLGNACDSDIDGDGFSNDIEIAAGSKPWQASSIPDGSIDLSDGDNDDVLDSHDNCPQIANKGQWDKDNDGQGNECDSDIDGDGCTNEEELIAGTKVWSADSYPNACNEPDIVEEPDDTTEPEDDGGNEPVYDSSLPRTAFVHLFEWQWSDIAKECETVLGPKGYAAVQVSPPQKSIEGSPWWTRYQPLSYQIEGRSGGRDEFIDMVSRCKAVGVNIYVDAVINHMAAGGRSYPDVPYASSDFHSCTTGIDFSDRWQIQHCDLLGLNDLATEKNDVQNKIAGYLNDLTNIGVAGFRIDAAKHMPAGDLAAIKSKLVGNPYVYQEVIGAGSEPVIPAEYQPVGDVTEFNFTRTLGHYFKLKAPLRELRYIGAWDGWLPSHDAVTFVANHDNQRQETDHIITHKDGFNANLLAHVFTLGWPYGYPKVMSSFDWQSHDQGPPATGASECNNGWLCEHRVPAIANMVGFRNHTQAHFYLSHVWDNGNHQLAWGRGGLGYVAINMENSGLNRTFSTGMPAGTYCDVISGDFDPVSKHCSGQTISIDAHGHSNFYVDPYKAVAFHKGSRINDECVGNCDNSVVNTTFSCTNAHTYLGQSVYVVGNLNELGNWDPARAVRLTPSNYPSWQGVIGLPKDRNVEWKCLKRDEHNVSVGIDWQDGGNNRFNSGSRDQFISSGY